MDSENESSKETVGEHQEAGAWVSWEFKRQRPDKVPGCQDVATLPQLEEGETSCGEGQHCFYFSCGKCSSLLALETLNPDYKNRMQYVPRISCIPAPEAFTEDNKYHGEIHEMYRRYFAQIPDLKGLAINGWSNKSAKNIFTNVPDTFTSWAKKQKTKDFEIDWILFNGATITVIEVMEKCKTSIKGNGKSFKKKLEQIKKDRIIIQHLLEVCGCKNTQVNYVIACPNVSPKEVTEGNFLNNHTRFFEKIEETGDRLGFIAEDCMVTGDVYMYKKETSTVEKMSFSEIIGSPYNVSRTHLWEGSYSLVTSSVVLSVLVVGNVIDSSSEHLMPDGCNFELKQNEKITRNLCRDMRAARNDFPELLVLGPEQLKIIVESKHCNKIVLLGGAGCGKTLILLFMVYQNTAKHLNESDCKTVAFVIPEAKTELKTFVEKFVKDFCNRNYVYIQSLESFRHFNSSRAYKLILLDEIYNTSFFGECSHGSAKIVVALGLFDGIPYETFPYPIPPGWTTFNLRSSYRNPSNVSSLCKKLRLLSNTKWCSSDIPLHFNVTLDCSLKVNDEDSIQIKHIDYCSEIGKEIAEKKEQTLLVADDENAFKSEFLNEYTLRVDMNFSDYKDSVRDLMFTGVQYKTVVILLKKSAKIGTVFFESLHHSISRSTHRVILLTPDPESYKTLLAATPVDLKVFEKLRRYQNVPKEDLFLLTNKEERSEALVLTILTENWSILESLIATFTSIPEASNIREDTIDILLRAFLRFGKEEILDILSKKFSDAIDIEQMLHSYIESAFAISILQYVPATRHLREQFMNLMPGRDLYTDFFCLIKSGNALYETCDLLDASFIWGDRRMFMQLVQMIRNDLHLFSRRLSELSSNLPQNMKELFNWVELSPEEIISLQQAEQVSMECSAWIENGTVKISEKELKKWNTAVPCCSTATKLFSGSDNFRQIFKFAFCNFFRSFFGTVSYNCQISLYFDSYPRENIKDQVPITTDEAIQLVEDFIISNAGIEYSESSVQSLSILLARILATSIEVNNPTIDKEFL